jgi:flagellar biosynthetic protein FlhB
VVAVGDFFYQRWEWERSLRMTVQEVREEHRDTEGDPLIKSRVRSVQRDMMRKRMMAAVPEADVVVTNPTHLAVALKYDTARMSAPIVVAKGAGHIAEQIRAVARKHGVAVVENKFVARTLYKLVDIGKEIPTDLYRAVAEILAFVFRARGLTPEGVTR